jgi:hypothetical protein
VSGSQKWALAAVALVAVAVAHPLCNLFFSCGCGFWGPAHCNIHQSMGPHCPWCARSWTMLCSALFWAAGAWLGARMLRKQGAVGVFGGGVIGFLIGAVISGYLTKVVTGYPTFL